jgi:hypothetical protein
MKALSGSSRRLPERRLWLMSSPMRYLIGSLKTMALFAVIIFLCAGCSGSGTDAVSSASSSSSSDEVVMRFTVMGDSGLGSPEFLEFPSSANIPQLTRNVTDIAALQPRPDICFMMGDLVMNFANDQGQTASAELDGWQSLFLSIPGSGSLNLVPYIGNHESCIYSATGSGQWPNSDIYTVWQNWIEKNGYNKYGGNGPTPSDDSEDLLVKDERYFSYSFTVQSVRFIVVNTDTLASPINPSNNEPYYGWIPIHWIEKELAKAEADPAVAHVFVLGHRPLVAPTWTAGEDEMPVIDSQQYPFATKLSDDMKACSKVRAYMCGHIHCQDMTRLGDGTGVMQIITGSSGSPLDPQWSPSGGTYFGFRLIKIYAGGGVGVVSYTRPTPPSPQLYYQDSPVSPPSAVPGQEVLLH